MSDQIFMGADTRDPGVGSYGSEGGNAPLAHYRHLYVALGLEMYLPYIERYMFREPDEDDRAAMVDDLLRKQGYSEEDIETAACASRHPFAFAQEASELYEAIGRMIHQQNLLADLADYVRQAGYIWDSGDEEWW